MRIGVVGAGALGSVFGGLLALAGRDVVLVRRSVEAAERIQAEGLALEGVSGNHTVKVPVVTDATHAGACDLVLVLVKAYDTDSAVTAVEALLAPAGVVLTLQNGVGNYEVLESAFPGKVLVGTTTNAALALGPGRFRHTGRGELYLGEAYAQVSERVKQVASALSIAELGKVHAVDSAMGSVWTKVIINACINAPATLLGLPNGALPATSAARELIRTVVQECVDVVTAKGITLTTSDPEAMVLAVCEATAPNLNSMYQDIRLGRRTEISAINGAIAKEGVALGVGVRTNQTLALLIEALEGAGQDEPGAEDD